MTTALGPGREFDAIRDLVTRWGDLAQGIGDDAASIMVPRGDRMVASVDSCVSGRHFQPDWVTPREIGHRAVAAALSDLAAMAALPLGVLIAIHLPDEWIDRLPALADGIGDAARASRTKILGGNISRAGELSVVTTVLGHAYHPIARDGAQPGDRVYVTGTLGGPGAAVRAWSSGGAPSPGDRARFIAPSPRILESRWLAGQGMRACIDISDGLAADAAHLAAASGRVIEIDVGRVPCAGGVAPLDAVASGEEYELLLTAPPLDVAAFEKRFGIPLTEIGSVVEGPADLRLIHHGARVAAAAGHDHLGS